MFVAKNIMTTPIALMGVAAAGLFAASLLKDPPAKPLPRPKESAAIPMRHLTAELNRRIEKKK